MILSDDTFLLSNGICRIHFPCQNVAVLNCVDCVASFFFNQGNVNHDGWHQRADAPRLGHKIPALLLRLLGCEKFDTPCGGGRWFESFMEHLRGANTQEWDAVASAMERCVWYLWQALKYSSYDHIEINCMITFGVTLHSLETEIWSKVGWVDVCKAN